MRRFALLIAALFIAGCDTAPSASRVASPLISCADPSVYAPRPTLTCAAAIAAASARLPVDHSIITRVEFQFGAWCPPGALCPLSAPDRGYVVFSFEAKSPLLVVVAQDPTTGALVAADAVPLPPLR